MPNRPLPLCSPPTLRPHHSPRLRGGPTIPMHSPSRLRMSSYKSPPSRPFFLANPSPWPYHATVLLSLPHVYFSPRGMKSASMHPSPPTFGFKIVLPPLLVTWWGTGPRLAVTGRAPHVMVVCLFVYDVFAGPRANSSCKGGGQSPFPPPLSFPYKTVYGSFDPRKSDRCLPFAPERMVHTCLRFRDALSLAPPPPSAFGISPGISNCR